MNIIEQLAHTINILIACTALASTEQTYSGKTYLIQQWQCTTSSGALHVRGWRGYCETDNKQHAYWGRMFFLEFEEEHNAFYANRFGEMGGGQGANVTEAYVPPCGT